MVSSFAKITSSYRELSKIEINDLKILFILSRISRFVIQFESSTSIFTPTKFNITHCKL